MGTKSKRGGLRNPPGGHPGNEALGRPKRKKCNLWMSERAIELGKLIKKERGYPGQGYAHEEALEKLAQEMGLT